MSFLDELKQKLFFVFIEDQRYMYIVKGLRTTILVTLLALVLGLIIGILVAVVRTAHDQMGNKGLTGLPGLIMKLLNAICEVYLTVIRGTPAMVCGRIRQKDDSRQYAAASWQEPDGDKVRSMAFRPAWP